MPAPAPHPSSDPGRVVAVCLGPGGIPKQPVAAARVTRLGLEGDRHRGAEHGGEARALCLLSTAELASLAADGVAHGGPGSYGENLLIDGLDFGRLRPGDRLAIGSEVVCELSDVRAPCANLLVLDERFPDLMLGRSGFLARVLVEGQVEPGMPVTRAEPS